MRKAWDSGELERARRGLYFTQRTIGDVQAAQRGRLVRRLARRSLTRSLFRLLGK